MFDDDSPIPDKPGEFRPRPARLPESREELTAAEMAEARQIAEKMTPAIADRQLRNGIEEVRYLSEIRDIMDDAMMLRAYSVRKNRTTGFEEIYNPVMFEKAMARRTAIVATAVRLVREIWSQRAQMEFYRVMVAVIAQESPATAHRLIEELRKINSPILSVTESDAHDIMRPE